MRKKPELLIPASSLEVLKIAVIYGADAVYIGGEVLKLRYGLYGEKELTQREIAKRLNISRSYVSRIEKNAVLKLRNCFLPS